MPTPVDSNSKYMPVARGVAGSMTHRFTAQFFKMRVNAALAMMGNPPMSEQSAKARLKVLKQEGRVIELKEGTTVFYVAVKT